MSKKWMLLATGALTALAFAALPAGASAEEMSAICSAVPCVGNVESTGASTLTEDSGLGLSCEKHTGKLTQSASPSTTVTVSLTFEGCSVLGLECNNAGAGTKKIVANTLTGHLITVVRGKPDTAGILLTDFTTTYECPGAGIKRTVTGDVIGTFEEPTTTVCEKAVTNHTIQFQTTGVAGQQLDKTWTEKTFDLKSGPHATDTTTLSITGTTHINYEGGKTVKITC